MTSTTALRKSAPLVLLMIITLLISIFVSTSQAVRCAVSQDRHIDLPENTHDVGSDDHSHEDGELLIWAKQPFEPDQDYGHCITAHVHIDENHDDHEHAGFHVESVFGTVSVGGNGPCPGETEERNDIMNKVKEMLGRAFDFPQDENLLEIRQPDYNPGAGGAIFREGIKCCDSDDTCYDPNSWVARTATEHDHNGAPMTAASRILIMAFVAMVLMMKVLV